MPGEAREEKTRTESQNARPRTHFAAADWDTGALTLRLSKSAEKAERAGPGRDGRAGERAGGGAEVKKVEYFYNER